MARQKLSEYRSKKIVNDFLGLPYRGWPVTTEISTPRSFEGVKRFVVKVDQAVKQRFKKGLIFLDVKAAEIPNRITELQDRGYSSFLIEPYVTHDGEGERYISFRREREGVVISYSSHGGVEIESHSDTIESHIFEKQSLAKIASSTGFSKDQLEKMRSEFDRLHMVLFEINPYVIANTGITLLDVAIEVDSSAELLVAEWSEDDIRTAATTLTEQERDVRRLNKESPASFNLEVINPNGSIFLLLSGGGASVVIADEIFTLGHGDALANYGEYSGNPTRDETYRYAGNVLNLLLKSKAKNKVVLVGGAVANFTDISATFEGIIDVLREQGQSLRKQGVKFYVRRGGPRQKEGLRRIEEVLSELGLNGGIYDPKVSIPEAVSHMIKGLE